MKWLGHKNSNPWIIIIISKHVRYCKLGKIFEMYMSGLLTGRHYNLQSLLLKSEWSCHNPMTFEACLPSKSTSHRKQQVTITPQYWVRNVWDPLDQVCSRFCICRWLKMGKILPLAMVYKQATSKRTSKRKSFQISSGLISADQLPKSL